MQTPAVKMAPSSPFIDFSPVANMGPREPSPLKPSSFNEDPLENGDALSICSNFSDLASAAYMTRSPEKEKPTVPATPTKSPVKAAPQTPRRSPSKAKAAATPRTAVPSTPTNASPRKIANATSRTAAVRATPRSVRTSQASPKASPKAPASVKASQAGSSLSSPRTPKANGDQTQNLLLDFTTQFDKITRPDVGDDNTPGRRRAQSSPRKMSSSALPPATPTESRFFTLLDFTPGPLATPRSIPSITPREVEEIRADYNTKVSLLAAQLNGKEAEADGLRTAVEKSEARCVELSNTVKEQAGKFETERESWLHVKTELGELFEAEKTEKATISMLLMEKETVVEHLHEELTSKDTEVTNLKKRLRDTEDELERTREEVIRIKTEFSAAAQTPVAPLNAPEPTPAPAIFDEEAANKRTQEELERVARELHNLYKTKHETKVAALKKSYESRWEKKVLALQQQVEALTKRNEELTKELDEKNAEQLTADMSFAPVTVGSSTGSMNDDEKEKEIAKAKEEAAKAKEEADKLKARDEEVVARLEAMEKQLEEEQQERKEVLALAEELMAIHAKLIPSPPPPRQQEKIEEVKAIVEEKTPTSSAGGLRSNIEKMGMGAKRAQMKAGLAQGAGSVSGTPARVVPTTVKEAKEKEAMEGEAPA
ncbi:central kinetochore-associated-domain-containing protein [Sphaerosporella brunnea]|uniref:Central kinetochore-associated-domain-containing protein n=1 Tax=Sphaerosporella brunnea TaxID=1250544 RepID=A0A5J5FBG7_9PEZI|nr:central kinetochore-associated-domain-containing protein [Sphaerosporella brunnea]